MSEEQAREFISQMTQEEKTMLYELILGLQQSPVPAQAQ